MNNRPCFALSVLLASLLGLLTAVGSARCQSSFADDSDASGEEGATFLGESLYDNYLDDHCLQEICHEGEPGADFSPCFADSIALPEKPQAKSDIDEESLFRSGYDSVHDTAVYGDQGQTTEAEDEVSNVSTLPDGEDDYRTHWSYEWDSDNDWYGLEEPSARVNGDEEVTEESLVKENLPERESDNADLDGPLDYGVVYGSQPSDNESNEEYSYEDDCLEYDENYNDAYSEAYRARVKGDEEVTEESLVEENLPERESENVELDGPLDYADVYGYQSGDEESYEGYSYEDDGLEYDENYKNAYSEEINDEYESSYEIESDDDWSSGDESSVDLEEETAPDGAAGDHASQVQPDDEWRYDDYDYGYDEEYDNYWNGDYSQERHEDPTDNAAEADLDAPVESPLDHQNADRIPLATDAVQLDYDETQYDCWCDPMGPIVCNLTPQTPTLDRQAILLIAHAFGRVAEAIEGLSRSLERLAGEEISERPSATIQEALAR